MLASACYPTIYLSLSLVGGDNYKMQSFLYILELSTAMEMLLHYNIVVIVRPLSVAVLYTTLNKMVQQYGDVNHWLSSLDYDTAA